MTGRATRILPLVLVAACADAAPIRDPQLTPHAPIAGSAAAVASATPSLPEAPLVAAKRLSLGFYDACAVLVDGGVACWGRSYGSTPHRIPGIDDAIDVHALDGEVAILRRDGTLRFAIATWASKPRAASVFEKLQNVVAFSREMWDRCALLGDGTVQCAANNDARARPVAGVKGATAISVGRLTACALGAAGSVWCWKIPDQVRPIQAKRVGSIEGAVELSVGTVVGCARLADKSVQCFSLESFAPHALADLRADTIDVADHYDGSPFPFLCHATGPAAACQYLKEDGSGLEPPFFEARGGTNIAQVTGRSTVRCLRDERGGVRCAGQNASGLLAAPQREYLETPRRLPDLPPMTSVSVSNLFICSLSRDGDVWCNGGPGWSKRPELGKAARLIANGGYACAWSAEGKATCAYVGDEGLRNVHAIAGLDGARDVVLPDLGHGGLVAAIGKSGELLIGPTPGFDSLEALSLTAVAGVQEAQRVVATIPLMLDPAKMNRESEVRALDARGQVFAQHISDQQIVGKVKRLPDLDGTLSLTYAYALKAGGELWIDEELKSRRLLAQSPLSSLVGDGACGIDRDDQLTCVDAAPAIAEHPDHRVMLKGVRAASGYDRLYVGIDKSGALHCVGDNGRELCGAFGDGVQESVEPRVVPLR